MRYARTYLLCAGVLSAVFFLGCGRPVTYQVKKYVCPFFINDSTICCIAIEKKEYYHTNSAMGAPVIPEVFDVKEYLLTTPLTSSGKPDNVMDFPQSENSELLEGVGFSYASYPNVYLRRYDEQCILSIDMAEKNMVSTPFNEVYFYGISWNGKQYYCGRGKSFSSDSTPSNYSVYDASTGALLTAVEEKRPINLDPSGKQILLLNAFSLEYFSLENSSVERVPVRHIKIVHDYRFGEVALARPDSGGPYTMVPEFAPLPERIANLPWDSIRTFGSVFNLRTGDFVYRSGSGTILLNNVLETSGVVILKDVRQEIN